VCQKRTRIRDTAVNAPRGSRLDRLYKQRKRWGGVAMRLAWTIGDNWVWVVSERT
jgi:hypothetical protein